MTNREFYRLKSAARRADPRIHARDLQSRRMRWAQVKDEANAKRRAKRVARVEEALR